MKRIAWILDTFPSRSETFIARDIAALRSRGFEIEVFALRAGEGARFIEKRGLLRADWKATGTNLGRTLASEGFAHVHAGWASHPAEIGRAAATAANLTFSFSGHARDLWVEGHDWQGKLAGAAFAHSCTQAGVDFLRRAASNLFSAAPPVIYAPHGVQLQAWPYRRYVAATRPLLLGVGRLVPKKGWDVWLHALGIMRNQNWQAVIIGEGPEEAALTKLIRSLRLENRVQLRGAVPPEQVRETMQAAQMLVFAGRTARDGDRDGLPNVLIEAAALGLPIVATQSGSVLEFGSEALTVCRAENPAELSDAMQHVLGNYSEAVAQAERARNIVEERYASDLAIGPLAEAFGRVLNI